MSATEDPHPSNDQHDFSIKDEGDRNADRSGTEPFAGVTVDHGVTSNRNAESEREVPRGPWWRRWWQEFRSEFSGAHPEKQVADIYYITSILAVAGSLLIGVWALGERFWSGTGSTAPHAPVTQETTTVTEPMSAQALSIVVLPFANLGADPAQDYFADGITHSLTTDLSRALPGSLVVARDTAFTYKGKPTDPRQIGRELHVRYALRGSVLLEGDQVRVDAQLIDTGIGNEIWAERFDTARSGLLQVQDEIVGRLSRAIGLQVVSVEARRREREKRGSAEAIDLVLRGQAMVNQPASAPSMAAARDLFEQALKLQPDNVDALAGVATTYIFEVLNGYYETDNDVRLQRAQPLLARALSLDSRDLIALKARAALLRAQGKFDEAIAASQAVIAQNPGEPWAYKEVGLSMMYRGRVAETLDWFAKADQFGPRDPGRWTWLGGKGQALILLGRDEEAIAALRAAIDSNAADISDYAVLAAAYALAGRNEEARAALAQYTRFRPGETVATFRNLSPVPLQLTDPSYQRQRERLKEGLRKAGMPD